MCESGIFVGGSLEDSQDTRTSLIVTGKGRGLTGKPPAFFFLWSSARTGGGGGLSPRTGSAPAVGSRREAADAVRTDLAELRAASVCSGCAPMRRIEAGSDDELGASAR
jgi:hypothetical protein